MGKKVIIGCFLLLTWTAALSQADIMQAYVQGKMVYLIHRVRKEENYYSLGRMFHIRPRWIAWANHLTFKFPLRTGMAIRIPLNGSNFKQTGFRRPLPGFLPVYHRVLKGETLYHICLIYGRFPESSIRKWNNLHNDQVNEGSKLVVGWVHVSGKEAYPDQHLSSPLVKNSLTDIIRNPVFHQTAFSRHSFTVHHTDIIHQIRPQGPGEGPMEPRKAIPENSVYEGLFNKETQLVKNLNTASGAAGWFKSDIPPGSKKYYALQDSVSRGTVIRVTNPVNGRYVYVKVLDSMPMTSDNENLLIRISDAARKDLGVTADQFFCELSYPH
ncbi:MAG TPA: LysM peptidoglycan-binding domain-containing protein [Chitinophagaceae bacterium]|nr:LysM peptidoglycan-binding domain-containing protein [Chitinophagaceae bacterium]